jgi:hypothetical protein
MRAAALLVALAGAALGQTTITPPQMRWGAPGAVEQLRLFAVGLDGMVQVHVGPGLRIAMLNGVPTLTADPVPLRIVSRVLTQDPNGNYVCPQCERVFRNGIKVLPGIDYVTNSNGILPLQPWAAEDTVSGEWIDKEEPPGPQEAVQRPTVIPASQIRNWAQVRLTSQCLWWHEQRSRYAVALGKDPPGRIDCNSNPRSPSL